MARGKDLAPAAEVAHQCRISRERLVRAITSGRVRGELREGRWFADRKDAQRMTALTPYKPEASAHP